MKVLQKNLLTLAVASALFAGSMVMVGSVQADDLPPAPPGPYAAEGMQELSAEQSVAGTSVEMKVPEVTAVAEPLKADAEEAVAPEAPKAGETETAEVMPGSGTAQQPQTLMGMPPQGMPPQMAMQQGMMPGYPMRQMPMMYGYPQYYQPRPQVQYIYVVPMMMPRRGSMTPQQMQQMQRSMNMYGGRPSMQGMMMNPQSMGGGHGHNGQGQMQHHEDDGHNHAEQGEEHHQDGGHDHENNDASQKKDNES